MSISAANSVPSQYVPSAYDQSVQPQPTANPPAQSNGDSILGMTPNQLIIAGVGTAAAGAAAAGALYSGMREGGWWNKKTAAKKADDSPIVTDEKAANAKSAAATGKKSVPARTPQSSGGKPPIGPSKGQAKLSKAVPPDAGRANKNSGNNVVAQSGEQPTGAPAKDLDAKHSGANYGGSKSSSTFSADEKSGLKKSDSKQSSPAQTKSEPQKADCAQLDTQPAGAQNTVGKQNTPDDENLQNSKSPMQQSSPGASVDSAAANSAQVITDAKKSAGSSGDAHAEASQRPFSTEKVDDKQTAQARVNEQTAHAETAAAKPSTSAEKARGESTSYAPSPRSTPPDSPFADAVKVQPEAETGVIGRLLGSVRTIISGTPEHEEAPARTAPSRSASIQSYASSSSHMPESPRLSIPHA